MSQRLHLKELLDEYLRIFEVELKTALNLKSAIKGHIDFIPMRDVPARVNGIWIAPEPGFDIARVMLPKELEITYHFRIVYVRRMLVNEVVNTVKTDETILITDKIIDKYRLEDLTLSGGQVLWSFPTLVEIEPPEDVYVSSIASDLVATAFNIETKVRTNHRV